jgi:hypothetical protein
VAGADDEDVEMFGERHTFILASSS